MIDEITAQFRAMVASDAASVPYDPFTEIDLELDEDDIPELESAPADAVFADLGIINHIARIDIAHNPIITYARDFYYLEPFLRGKLPLPEWVGIDIETEVELRPDVKPGAKSGLNPIHTAAATVQIEIGGRVWVTHWDAPAWNGPGRAPCNMYDVPGIEFLIELFEIPYVWKAIHNAEFEWKFFLHELQARMGRILKINAVWDTKLGEWILAEGRGFTLTQGKFWVPRKGEKPKKFLALGDCIMRRYGYQMEKGLDVRLSFMRGPAGSLTQRQISYAADDSVWCRMLAEDQYKDMLDMEAQGVRMLHTMLADCEMIEAVGRMSLNGVYFDKTEAMKLWAEIEYEVAKNTEAVRKAFYMPGDGEPVLTEKTKKQKISGGKPVYKHLNLNSEAQMVPRLQAFGIPVEDYKTTTLKHFDKYTGIAEIMLVKQLDKLKGTYLEPTVTKHWHPWTSCVYFNLNLAVAVTGRLSSSKPNMQNLPTRTEWGRRVRKCFKPRPGNRLLEWDYSNIELKLIAERFNDPNMIRAFKSKMDLHALMGAVLLYDISDFTWENLEAQYNIFYPQYKAGDPDHKKNRQAGKQANFGLGFGAGPLQLQYLAWRDAGQWWEVEFCKKVRTSWLSTWSGVRAYHYHAAQLCKAHADRGTPIISETMDGRRRWIDPRTGYSEWLNHQIQGTSADMTKRAINIMKREINLVLTVHDSIMADVPEHEAEATLKYGEDVMVSVGQRYLTQVPVTVDAKSLIEWAKD